MIVTFLHTLISRTLLIILIAILAIPVGLCLLVPEKWRFNNPIMYALARFFYWAVLKGSLVPITYKGLENLPDEPVIIAANHQSSLDIPLVGILAKNHQHIWLATTDLLKSFIFRLFLPRCAVLVDVSSPSKAMRSLIKAIKMVNGKYRHLMIFPEGGRFSDDHVHPFYGGFTILAKKTGKPVVPVRIFHANKVYPRDSFWVQWHPITVVVGKPFVYQEDDTQESFKNRVYQWFVDQKE